MSKPWNPRTFRPSGRRRSSHGGTRISWGEVRLFVLCGCVAGLIYAGSAQVEASRPIPPGSGAVRLAPADVRIVDGDTFWYGGEKIRIADIDTPEVRGRCAYESQLAARATDRMGELLEAGPFELETIPGRDEDRYGRKLRVVTRGGRSLGDQLVAEGLARTWTGRREPWCA
jgi:endonuclease YncB( thermonuclease family)